MLLAASPSAGRPAALDHPISTRTDPDRIRTHKE